MTVIERWLPCHSLQEKEELADRLEKSEKQLRERQSEPTTASGDVSSEKAGRATASGGASGKRVEHGSSTEGAGEEAIREEEGELLRLKKEYEDEITELRSEFTIQRSAMLCVAFLCQFVDQATQSNDMIIKWTLFQWGSKVSTNWSNTWKHARYYAFMCTLRGNMHVFL